MAKNLDSVYERGRRRSGAWRRMRLDKGQEFVTGGYTPGAKYFDGGNPWLLRGWKTSSLCRATRNGFTHAARGNPEILPRPSDSYALFKVFVSLRDGIEYQLNPA